MTKTNQCEDFRPAPGAFDNVVRLQAQYITNLSYLVYGVASRTLT
jgi:hypothetical protein